MTLKAGEMRAMVGFSYWLMQRYGGVAAFGGPIMGAAKALRDFIDEIGQGEVMPDASQMARIRSSYDVHLRLCRSCGITLTPKHHLCCHLVHRTRWVLKGDSVMAQPVK
jgi:hypothetical protein